MSHVLCEKIVVSLTNNFWLPKSPDLPRQLKTHIGFSMFPILDTNLLGKPTLWTTICSLVAVWESSSKITWSSSGHSCMGVFVSVCFLGLQTPKCMGPGCNAEYFCFRVIALKEFQSNSCLFNIFMNCSSTMNKW